MLFTGALIPFFSGSSQEALWQTVLAVAVLGASVASFERPFKRLGSFARGWNYVWFMFLAVFVLRLHGTNLVEAIDWFTALLVVGALGDAIFAAFASVLAVRGSTGNSNIFLPVISSLITVGLVVLAIGNANGSRGISRAGGAVLFIAAFAGLAESMVILAGRSQSGRVAGNAVGHSE